MKHKVGKVTLLSGLALAAAVSTTTVFADDINAAAQQNVDANTAAANTDKSGQASADDTQNSKAVNTDTAAAKTDNKQETDSPIVTVTDTKTEGQTTTTTSQVESKALNEAKAAAKEAKVKITETANQQQPSIEAADADNKVQAQAINKTVSDYNKAKEEYAQKQKQYQKDLEDYKSKKAEYEIAKKAYEDYQKEVAAGKAAGRVETAQSLVFRSEPEATMTIEGVSQYLTKEARAANKPKDILEQFNTDNYSNSDYVSQNPYTPKEDTWFKMKVGDQITVTYNNIKNSSYMNKKISKVVSTYKLNSTTSNDGTTLVELFHDPTKTIFIGAQTANEGRKDQISVTMQLTFFDENGDPINLSGNNAIMSLSSLNHWKTAYGDHIEKVNLGGNEFVKIPGSSVDLHGDTIYSANDNQYKANGAAFNGDGEDGWDAINEDGFPRAATAYYGAGAMTYKGQPFTFSVGGNDKGVPTTFWFSTNSVVAVPKDPGEEPVPPTEPKLTTPSVTWHKNFVVQTSKKPTPPKTTGEPPKKPTPKDPVKPTPNVPVKPTPAPKSVNYSRPAIFRSAKKNEVRVRERQYTAPLPQTGDEKQYGLSVIGFVSASFAAATLMAAKRRKKEN
ncbi:GbpC/Spa domain-containing protein [Streptococcus macacae]|uniref:Glucan-binding protein C n=2 Tax=Streptococcus macacae TaxID=1339 RepID=G5JUL9_9STRE|nr:GbpC/Spa domain-containing protein [Streptococcus macacae]EHJ53221.1 glucan-binding protein C [Streptococcus macacae NCTC 11558]BAD99419.1 glucan binding protein C [Streptococcus macacae NCTC 11558]SUN78660.1 Glucan-binding protein C [Streptococcus macacae NCTC 11558]